MTDREARATIRGVRQSLRRLLLRFDALEDEFISIGSELQELETQLIGDPEEVASAIAEVERIVGLPAGEKA